MVVLIYLLIAVGVIAMSAGGVWLLVVAFRTGTGWGLACFFIPLAALVYVIMHWREAKAPFLVNLGGTLWTVAAVMGLAGYTASTSVSDFAEVTYEEAATPALEAPSQEWWQEEGISTPIAEPLEEPADTLPGPTPDLELRPTIGVVPPHEESLQPTPEPTLEPPRRREWGRPIELAELDLHLGQPIEIHTVDGKPYKVILQEVNESSIQVKDLVGTGHVSFAVPFTIITEVRVRAPE